MTLVVFTSVGSIFEEGAWSSKIGLVWDIACVLLYVVLWSTQVIVKATRLPHTGYNPTPSDTIT